MSQNTPPAPIPGVIASFEDLRGIDFKTILGSVTRYDEPPATEAPPFTESLSMHYWHIKQGEVDDQRPHLQDEIYIVLEGIGQVKVDGEISDIKKGDIIFVPAKMEHNFIADKSDMRILIFFAPNWDGIPA